MMMNTSEKGFSMIEMVVVLVIAVLAMLFTFGIFNNANRAAIHQDFLSDVQGNLRITTEIMSNEITTAGFGFRDAKDYGLRTYNNVANVLPSVAGFSPPTTTNANNRLTVVGGGAFQVPALAGSDAILTTRSDPTCESLVLDVAGSTFPASQAGNFNVIGCLNLVDIPNKIAGQNTCQISRTPLFPTPIIPDLSGMINRTLLIVDQDPATQQARNVAIQITSAQVEGNTSGSCPGAFVVMRIQGTGQGLQISNNYATPMVQPVARLVTSAFFYVGQDLNLYNIPLTYTFAGASQTDRIVAENVDSLQLRYFMYNQNSLGTATARDGGLQGVGNTNGIFDQTVSGNANCLASDSDGIPQSEDIRLIDLAVTVKARNPDLEGFAGQGRREQLFDDPTVTPADSFRRRTIRKQILARNLNYFQAQCVAGY